jgi:hypothetical protein
MIIKNVGKIKKKNVPFFFNNQKLILNFGLKIAFLILPINKNTTNKNL